MSGTDPGGSGMRNRWTMAAAMLAWVTDSPNWANTRVTSLDYRFLSSMQGGLGIGANLDHRKDADFATAAKWVAAYKTIRSIRRGPTRCRCSAAGRCPRACRRGRAGRIGWARAARDAQGRFRRGGVRVRCGEVKPILPLAGEVADPDLIRG
jgi:hypothetical protein